MVSCVAEWHFIQNLSYREQLHSEDAAFVRLAYTARLHSVPLRNATLCNIRITDTERTCHIES